MFFLLVITSVFSVEHRLSKIIIDKGLSEEVLKDLRAKLSQTFKDMPRIETRDSENVAGIQMADLAAWAIRRHLSGDSLFYPYIENKIRAKIEV